MESWKKRLTRSEARHLNRLTHYTVSLVPRPPRASGFSSHSLRGEAWERGYYTTSLSLNSVPQHLEWLESECDSFLAKHTQMGDSLESAETLKSQYEKFQEAIEVSVQSDELLKSGDLTYAFT